MADAQGNPLISIVIPSYDRAQVVGRAVASAFAQEGVEVEVIVVDDGSKDDTSEVLKALAAVHGPALRVHVQENAGASAARNAGLDLARGDYIQFLDSDDMLEPEKLRLQLAAFQTDPALPVVLCHGWLEENGVEIRIGPDLGSDPQPYIELMCGRDVHVIQTSAPLWRRTFLTDNRRWNPAISLGDDLEFHVRCLADTDKVGFLGQALFSVRAHSGDRLSDFSAREDRLASLLQTRRTIHEVLVDKGRWSVACAENTAAALRSIYAVYLQRMPAAEVDRFDRAAVAMSGPGWRGIALTLMSRVRQLGGPRAAERFFRIATRLRALAQGLVSKVFSPRVWIHRVRNLVGRIRRFSLRDEIRSIATLRDIALRNPHGPRALYVEPNEFHAETIPGLVALLAKAGFQTTVLHRPSSPVADALCRLPVQQQPRLFSLTLRGMRRFLRSESVRHYEFILFGSGTISEKFVYFGGLFDYLGTIPNGRSGHMVIEHASTTLLRRGDRLRSQNAFALREMAVGKTRLGMLAPVDFGAIDPAPLSEPVVFVVVGRLEPNVRDVVGLFDAVRGLVDTEGPAFQVDLIGDATLSEVPEDIRGFFHAHGRLSFAQMYEALDRAHFLLPLLDSRTESHRRYLRHNTTGTRQLSFGFLKPMVMDRAFAAAYGFDPQVSAIHAPGRLQHGFEAARRIDARAYGRMQDKLREMKFEIESASLSNLETHLHARELAG